MTSGSNSGGEAENENGTAHNNLPSTHWSQLIALRAGTTTHRTEILDSLLRRYWKPVYCYLRRCGCSEEDAKDLVQEFFAECLRTEFFAKADQARGRFRNFMLRALQHFVANVRRAAQAQKRRPPQGLLSLEELAAGDSGTVGFEPASRQTPDAVFHRVWVADLTQRVLRRLGDECRATGKLAHYEIFRQCLVLPALEGTERPSLGELAGRLGISEKQAANCLLSARRAYIRLLEDEIRAWAGTEDEVAAEIRDLLAFLGEATDR